MAPFDNAASGDVAAAGLVMAPSQNDVAFAPRAIFDIECLDAEGRVKWAERAENLVTTAGKVDLLGVYFGAGAKPAGWYLVLKGAGAAAAADTLSTHAGWVEESGVYTGVNRPTVGFAAAAANGDNGQIATSSAVSVAITAAGTIAGCGLTPTQAKATLTGVLYNAGDFSASRTVANGDTLNVTLTLTIT